MVEAPPPGDGPTPPKVDASVPRRLAFAWVAVTTSMVCVALVLSRLWGQGDATEIAGRLHPAPFAAAVGAWLVAALLAGPRYRGLLPPGMRARAPAGLELGTWMIAVHMLNLALPGPAGDVAFVGMLSRRHGLPLATVAAAMAWARVLGLFSICLLGLVVLPFTPDGSRLAESLAVVGMLVAAAGLLLASTTLVPSWSRRACRAVLTWTLPWTPGPLQRVSRGVHARVDALWARLEEDGSGSLRPLLGALAWSAAIQGSLLASLAWALSAVGLSLEPHALVASHVTGELAALAIAVTPAGVGGFDLSLGAALVAFAGLDARQAVLGVLSLRAVQVVALGVGTAWAGWRAPELLAPARRDAAP